MRVMIAAALCAFLAVAFTTKSAKAVCFYAYLGSCHAESLDGVDDYVEFVFIFQTDGHHDDPDACYSETGFELTISDLLEEEGLKGEYCESSDAYLEARTWTYNSYYDDDAEETWDGAYDRYEWLVDMCLDASTTVACVHDSGPFGVSGLMESEGISPD